MTRLATLPLHEAARALYIGFELVTPWAHYIVSPLLPKVVGDMECHLIKSDGRCLVSEVCYRAVLEFAADTDRVVFA